ncbi:hypothetical protein AS888_05540 [Peribacillus simplex]|uniref:Uncharacterized protein n=1 Tax=Peribacillus simplex TaxID=1478 RepID=A0A109N1W7_9BACI|nr:hypothetical protein AS888_05540 [Peribacillus simplex]
MNYVRFCVYQFILFSAIFVINIPLDKYIGKPFTSVDLLAICISIFFILIVYGVINKIYSRFENIRLRNKILISIPIVILSILFIGILEQLFV